MCGFFILKGELANSNNLTNKISKLLAHRGPDAYAHTFYDKDLNIIAKNCEPTIAKSLVTSFFRLSIRDVTDSSMQPLEVGYLSIFFNGEIYNTKFLKKKFKLDSDFRSDSLILGEGIARFGHEFVQNLNGMFAIAILDRRSKQVTLYRDNFGIKPMYYSVEKHQILIGSELNIMTQYVQDKSLNPENIEKKLLGFVDESGEETDFKNIKKVKASHCVKIDLKNNKIIQNNIFSCVLHPPKQNFEQTITNAFKRHLISDREICFLLSSGVDSTLLSQLALELSDKPIFYTFKNRDNPNLDESINVQKMWGDHNVVYVDGSNSDLLNSFNKFCNLSSELETDFTVAAQGLIYDFIGSTNNKVVFSGQGADELFCGYPGHIRWYIKDLLDYNKLEQADRMLAYFQAYSNENWYIHLQNHLAKKYKSTTFKSRLRRLLSPKPIGLTQYKNKRLKETLPRLLRWEDLNSMRNGIEARVPYLDLEVAAISKKIRNGELFDNIYGNKKFLRQLANLKNPKLSVQKPTKKLGYSVDSKDILSLASLDKEFKELSEFILNKKPPTILETGLIYFAKGKSENDIQNLKKIYLSTTRKSAKKSTA